jgi:hypothetical protein
MLNLFADESDHNEVQRTFSIRSTAVGPGLMCGARQKHNAFVFSNQRGVNE